MGEPIILRYLSEQTWISIFGDLATTLDKCKAKCVGSYLITDKDLPAIFGYTNLNNPIADDCTLWVYISCSNQNIY